MATELKRMRQLIGSTADWAAHDLVIGDGELAITRDAGVSQEKIGDGVKRFSELGYVTVNAGSVVYEDSITYPPGSVGSNLTIISRTIPLNVQDFGVFGNDNAGSLVDESVQMQAAIDAASAQKRSLYIPGTNYMFKIVLPTSYTALELVGDPANRPILHMLQSQADAGSYILSGVNLVDVPVTIAANVITGQQRITLTSTAGLVAGMIIRWASNQLWYYDPRAQWYKGELHLITRIVSPTVIEIHGQTWDTYNIAVETLTAVAFAPKRLRMSDLHFKGKVPATNVSTQIMQLRGLYMPEFDRIKMEVATSSGLQLGFSWFAKLRRIETMTLGKDSDFGYGILDTSNVGTIVDGLTSRGCRRAVDCTSFTGTASSCPDRKATVTNFDISGGGVEAFGGVEYEPAGSAPSFGLGGHGPAEDIFFTRGRISNIGNGITVRGRKHTINRVSFAGKMNECIDATFGTGLFVNDCEVDYTDYPNKSADTAIPGDTTLQPNYFVKFGSGASGAWNYDGGVSIQGTKATGLRFGFVRFESSNDVSRLTCINNTVIARPGSADTFTFYIAPSPTNISSSVLGPNSLDRLTGNGGLTYMHSNIVVGFRASATSAVEMHPRSYRSLIPDDQFITIRFAGLAGGRVIVTLNTDDGTVRGVFQIVPLSATLAPFGSLGSNVDGSAVSLNGTTGVDGKFTVHMSSTFQLSLENRRGVPLTVDVSLM